MKGFLRRGCFEMETLEDIGIESDGQLYLFKSYFEVYDLDIVFPRICYEMFNWMNYYVEPLNLKR